tara:strand:+ start:5921 stop:6166 length:246 start_codon:yes stop_codon:yes gene_type:complete
LKPDLPFTDEEITIVVEMMVFCILKDKLYEEDRTFFLQKMTKEHAWAADLLREHACPMGLSDLLKLPMSSELRSILTKNIQ